MASERISVAGSVSELYRRKTRRPGKLLLKVDLVVNASDLPYSVTDDLFDMVDNGKRVRLTIEPAESETTNGE